MQRNALGDIAIVRKRYAAVAATSFLLEKEILEERDSQQGIEFSLITFTDYQLDNFVACIGCRRGRSSNSSRY
jgi:hypothetical protein